jgi:hypothetical protein
MSNIKRERYKAMDSREAAGTGDKAKRETEAFINNHIDDHAKGWPILCPHGPVNTEYSQKKDFRTPDIPTIRLTG